MGCPAWAWPLSQPCDWFIVCWYPRCVHLHRPRLWIPIYGDLGRSIRFGQIEWPIQFATDTASLIWSRMTPQWHLFREASVFASKAFLIRFDDALHAFCPPASLTRAIKLLLMMALWLAGGVSLSDSQTHLRKPYQHQFTVMMQSIWTQQMWRQLKCQTASHVMFCHWKLHLFTFSALMCLFSLLLNPPFFICDFCGPL